MTWRVWGEQLLTADFSGTPRVYQAFKFPYAAFLKSLRVTIAYAGSPAFTDLRVDLYSNSGGSPGTPSQLLYSTTAVAKADIMTLANGLKEVYFAFPKAVPIVKSDWYHLVLTGTGYTGTTTSHVAWVHAWPDPVNKTNLTTTFAGLLTSPYAVTFSSVRVR